MKGWTCPNCGTGVHPDVTVCPSCAGGQTVAPYVPVVPGVPYVPRPPWWMDPGPVRITWSGPTSVLDGIPVNGACVTDAAVYSRGCAKD